MSQPSLVQLETLCWISRLGTFTAAAERVHATQSAVSARMRELEGALGVALFRHRGRRAELTVEGRRLVRRAEAVLTEASLLGSGLTGVKASAGMVRVGLADASTTLFAQLLGAMKRELPAICYEVDIDLAINLRHKLELGILDLIVIAGRLEHANLRSARVGRAQMLWAMAPALRGRGTTRVVRDELLRSSPLWCIARPSTAYTLAIDSLRELGANLDNVNTCTQISALADFVQQGGGIGLLPEGLIADRLRRSELVRVPGTRPVAFDLTIACERNQRQPVVLHLMDTAIRRMQRSMRRQRATAR
jgi:DNA-binding transcriptional LysR family regulator